MKKTKYSDFSDKHYSKTIPHYYAKINPIDQISKDLPNAKTISMKDIKALGYPIFDFYKPISTIIFQDE